MNTETLGQFLLKASHVDLSSTHKVKAVVVLSMCGWRVGMNRVCVGTDTGGGYCELVLSPKTYFMRSSYFIHSPSNLTTKQHATY